MNRLILNIGLNVGVNEPTNQLSRTLYTLDSQFYYNTIVDIKVSENFGSWGKERVLVLCLNTVVEEADLFIPNLEKLCEKLSQDAIAFTFNGVGHIAFNPNYTGEKFIFNPDYFKVFQGKEQKV